MHALWSKLLATLLCAAPLLVSDANASAILEAIDPGVSNASVYTTDNNNNLGLGSESLTILVGDELEATGPGTLIYQFIGKDASWTDIADFSPNANGCSINNQTAIKGITTCDDTIDSSGALIFSLSSSGTGVTVNNGDDFSLYDQATIFGLLEINDDNWYIFFDDGGGSGGPGGPDRDFDDLGIEVTFIPSNNDPSDPPGNTVPEPETFGLMGLGLLGIFLARRKK